MKLKCAMHKRRVHVLDQGVTVHREDGSHCQLMHSAPNMINPEQLRDWPALLIGQEAVRSNRVWLMQRNLVKRWRTNHKGKGSPRAQFWGRDHR